MFPYSNNASSEQNVEGKKGPSFFKQKDDDDDGGDDVKITNLVTRRKLKPRDSQREKRLSLKTSFHDPNVEGWAQ